MLLLGRGQGGLLRSAPASRSPFPTPGGTPAPPPQNLWVWRQAELCPQPCQPSLGSRDTSTSPERSAPTAPHGARTMGASLLRDGDVLLEEAMEVGLSGTASFLPKGTFSTPFSRDE